jgi:hypothetical protein
MPRRTARPLQGGFDRRLAGVEHRGDLGRPEPEHVTQHEHRALKRRQAL